MLTSQRAPRVRAWLALILVIMAVVAVIVSCVALWSSDLVFNTDTYVKTIAPVADDPQVRHAVSVYVTDKAIAATDLNTRIENALPSDAKVLATPLTSQLRGFLVGDHVDRRAAFLAEVGGWLAEGRIRLSETIVDGVENAPAAFIGLMRGENVGKMLVRVGGD